MIPKSLSAIVLRLLGVWFLFDAFFSLLQLFLFQQELAGLAGVHRRWYESPPPVVTSGPDVYLHDTYYVLSHYSPGTVLMGLKLFLGILLLLWSKPLGRLLARGLDHL